MSRIHTVATYRLGTVVGVLLCGLAISSPIHAQFYLENFDGVRGLKITDAGFTGRFWKLASVEENKFMVSVAPQPPAVSSVATSPELPFRTAKLLKRKGGFTVQFELEYAGILRRHFGALGKRPRTALALLDHQGRRVLTVAVRPNPPGNVNRVNLSLINHLTKERKFAKTHTVTPFEAGAQPGTADLRIAFLPNTFGGTTVQVFYGPNGDLGETPLIVHEFQGLVQVHQLSFRHRSGRDSNKTRVAVDDISVQSNDVVLFPVTPSGIFDHEVLTSDGSTREVFDAESYLQGTFQLVQAAHGDSDVESWDSFLTMIHFVKNMADNVNGVPLLITKADFTALGGNQKPESKTFFMGAFAEERIAGQDITILSDPAFQWADDIVESIDLDVDGVTVSVDPNGRTPFQFFSKGEKIVRLTVRFASGFVGENRFRIFVE